MRVARLEQPAVRPILSLSGESVLLIIAGTFLLINFLALTLIRGSSSPADWLHLAVWIACAALGYHLLNRFLPQHDPFLFPLTMFLSGWGLVLIDRLAPQFADRQTIWLPASVIAMLLVALLPHPLRWLRSYRYVLLLVGILLLTGTILLGTNPSGVAGSPQLWLGIGSFFFQPSEALKIILVAFLASYLAEQQPLLRAAPGLRLRRLSLSPRILGPIFLMWGLSVIILIWQRDLGTAMLFFIVFLLMLYLVSGSLAILLIGLLMMVAAGLIAYQAFSVVQLRVDIWINPWPEADNRAYQIVQSLMAFAAGGPLGQGIAQGYPTYIPVVHSDFVFAALAEEWGLVGVLAVIAAIITLVSRGLLISIRLQRRPFRVLLGIGLSLLVAVQSLLIMAGVLKLVPLTGVTLPFVSYGGSSLLASFVIVGFLLRLSTPET
jgi:cell division protein FtsW (lipid II flippase)